jgi:prevent-host-death family protein
MAKRTPKSISKPLSRKSKTGQFVELGMQYGRDVVVMKNAARGVIAARSERTTARGEPLPPRNHRSVPATQAKNRFGEILQTARDSGPVFIERHGQAQAVVLGIDTYNKLTSNERTSQERELDYWTREFNALHARMQTHKARVAVDALFSATDAELNRRDN